jgi:hypothetical protein
MKAHLTPHDIANTVRMMRTLHSGAIIIVEGDTDLRVYQRFVDEKRCRLVPGNGRPNTIGSLSILENAHLKGILAIIDADFWKLDGVKPSSSNLVLTDTHDLETMILSSNALDKVLSEFGSTAKIGRLGKPVRTLLLEAASPIGFFRWLSSPTKDNLFLRFKGLNFDGFLNKRTLEVDLHKLIKQVEANTPGCIIDLGGTTVNIQKLKAMGHDLWQVCSGHDMTEILTMGLRSLFGNARAAAISTEVVDGVLRISYEHSYFRCTQLHTSIKSWEEANQDYKILRS